MQIKKLITYSSANSDLRDKVVPISEVSAHKKIALNGKKRSLGMLIGFEKQDGQ